MSGNGEKSFEKGEEVTHSAHGLSQVIADMQDGRVLVKVYGDSEDEDRDMIVSANELRAVEEVDAPATVAVASEKPVLPATAVAPMPQPDDPIDILVKYGIPGTPLRGKAPFLTAWQNCATTDEAQMRAWSRIPGVTGFGGVAKAEIGGFWVLETDSTDVAKRFKDATGETLPNDGLVTRSRQGGHRWFKQTAESIAMGNIPQGEVIGQDFSARVHNQQCVMPGSWHPLGGSYSMAHDAAPKDASTTLINWLKSQEVGAEAAAASVKSMKAKTETTETNVPTPSSEPVTEEEWASSESFRSRICSDEVFRKPGRNNTLSSYCFLRWVNEGCTAEELEADAREFNAVRLVPPLDRDEVTATVNGKLKLAQKGSEVKIAGAVVEKVRTAPVFIPPPTVEQVTQQKYEQGVQENADKADKIMDDLQKAYDDADLDAEPADESEANPYPMEAWAGTPIGQFADIATKDNFIPKEYFVNALVTVLGSICSKRIKAAHNSKQMVNLYTLLLSEDGGGGKNTAIDWSTALFPKKSELVRKPEGSKAGTGIVPKVKNVGTYLSSFASERGALNAFEMNDTVLQVYSEFTTLLEKTGINGSGAAFKDTIMNMYDAPTIVWSEKSDTDKKTKNRTFPDAVYNSIMAATTKDKWDEAGGLTSDKTFIERLNIIAVDKVKPVGILTYPEEELKKVRKVLLAYVGWLETRPMIWHFTPEAKEVFDTWFAAVLLRKEADQEAGVAGVTESYGRINTYCLRFISHLALWLAPTPKVLETLMQKQLEDCSIPQVFDEETGEVAEFGDDKPNDLTWEVEVTPEIVRRAILIAEYQIKARKQNLPADLDGADSLCENRVIKWATKLRSTTIGVLYKRGGLSKWGIGRALRAVSNVEKLGYIKTVANPRGSREMETKVIWWGDGTKQHKWVEGRGGKRAGAGRKPTTAVTKG
jgi:hypothetical protein